MVKEKMEKETQEKLMQLQLLQQRLQVFAAQKQQIQIEQIEVENALKAISNTKKPVYSLVGNIMVERSASDLKKELTSQKKEVDIKIKSIERQEKKSQDSAEEIQSQLTKLLK